MRLWRRPVSIRGRLMRSLLVWSVLWCSALGLAMWLSVREEVNELLDDSLQSAAEALIGPFVLALGAQTQVEALPPSQSSSGRFMWQLVAYPGGPRVLTGSRGAPTQPLFATPTSGFGDQPGWRIYGMPAGHDGQMLYVAQTRDERLEAELEIGFAVLVSGLPMAVLALLWLRARVRQEMQPLQDLSRRLAVHDPLLPGATLGPAGHEELEPVHTAIDDLAARLARRVARERAFTAHAAHALRTPLAGIDAQLAVALREAPAQLQGRLQRVRTAASRLQRVVTALLALFRSGAEVQRELLDIEALVARLPLDGLQVEVLPQPTLQADADLVTAALLNLLDNSLRHGGRHVVISQPAPQQLQVQDDGPGVGPTRRRELQQALDLQDYAGRTGLGLMLADLVARAHGGRLELPAADPGFLARMHL